MPVNGAGKPVCEKAAEQDAETVFELVRDTILAVYPKYYRDEIVDFFCAWHSLETILKEIRQGNVYVLRQDGILIGTGSIEGEHITRVYVAQAFQGKGYGGLLVGCLEREIAKDYPAARVESSLPACRFYEHCGYRTIGHEQWPVENGVILVYEIMEKVLQSA